MKWLDIFRSYNIQMFRKNKANSIFIVASILLAVSISLAIPQVVTGLNQYWENEAGNRNGADLKIEASFESPQFDQRIKELKNSSDVFEVQIYNSTIKNEKTQVYSDLLVGNYSLESDEIIISLNVATTLNVTVGNTVTLLGEDYTVKEIEESPIGVGEQAELMGYAKVSSYQGNSEYVSSRLWLINDESYERISTDLKKIEKNYVFTTVLDVQEEMGEKTDTEAMSLNILNTMSIIMTVLSVISSIFLIISKSRQDISIMKMVSINGKHIKIAFKIQFICLVIPAILVGAGISIFIAYFLLKGNNIPYQMNTRILLGLLGGIILFTLVYLIYINISCKLIEQIDPLLVLKAGEGGVKRRRIIIYSILFTFLTLFVYSLYVGTDNIFSGSILILITIAVFFIVILILISIVTKIKLGKVINRYFLAHIKEKKFSIALTILSLSFTILFFLVGFTLSQTISDSYTKSMKQKINYNYMLVSKDEKNIEGKLLQTSDTGTYTKLYLNYALMYQDSGEEVVIFCGVDSDEYFVEYNILEGVGIFEGEEDEVLISNEMAEKYNFGIGDSIEINEGVSNKMFVIKGIYESGGMNQNHILIHKSELENQTQTQSIMYLANISSQHLIKSLEDVQIVNLENVSSALDEAVQSYLTIFKSLCIICIISSLVFNINIVYMNSLEDYKNFVIIRAIGLGKLVLYKNIFIEAISILALTLLMSVGLYCLIANFAIKMMFNIDIAVNGGMILTPILIALAILLVVFIIPVLTIQKSSSFEELRELV